MPTETESIELIDVDVSRAAAREAVRIADEHDLAIEDALARLTAYDYPTDVVATPPGTAGSSSES